jgi:hypothetical protein
VDSSTLRRLGEGGFDAVPWDELHDLSEWCRDWCETTGDGRFCVLADVLRMIYQWDSQGVPTDLLTRVEAALTAIPGIMDADVTSGTLLAVGLREEVGSSLLSPGEWIAQGYASRGSVQPPPLLETD